MDIQKIRANFPILSTKIYGKPLIYLDNASTTHKPIVVVDKIREIYNEYNSNIHRAFNFNSQKMTEDYENAREYVKYFINADKKEEIIFTSGTTESANIVAYSFCEKFLNEGDEIIVSEMEHHSNIVPWQMAADRKKAKLKVLPINEKGELMIDELENLITSKTKIITLTHISNALGTINPVKLVIDIAHKHNIPVFIDAAQSIAHFKIDVQQLDCDFLAFSGHKVYAPTGIGVLYGKGKYLSAMPPYKGGGDMIDTVTFEKTTYQPLPLKYEAGTSNYVGAVALAEALKFVENNDFAKIEKYEKELLEYAENKIKNIDGVKIYGNAKEKAGVISFLIDKVPSIDTGMVLDKMGIAVRTGLHCAQPLMDKLKIQGTVRASFCFYNTFEEIDALADGIFKIKKLFA